MLWEDLGWSGRIMAALGGVGRAGMANVYAIVRERFAFLGGLPSEAIKTIDESRKAIHESVASPETNPPKM